MLAAATFLSVATGPAVSSNQERPYYSLGQSHIWLGATVAVLTILLVILIEAAKQPSWLRRTVWINLAAIVLETLIGFLPLPQAPAVRIAHAFLGQLLFPLIVLIAFWTSRGWATTPEQAEGTRWLRRLMKITPVVMLAQVALGILHRHGAIGVAPHLFSAFIVVFFVLGLALPVIYRPQYHALHRVAAAFLISAVVQVLLGFVLFTMVAVEADPSVTILMTLIHAAMAALTLAATVMMAVLIRRRITL